MSKFFRYLISLLILFIYFPLLAQYEWTCIDTVKNMENELLSEKGPMFNCVDCANEKN